LCEVLVCRRYISAFQQEGTVNEPVGRRFRTGVLVAIGLTTLCLGLTATSATAQILYGNVVGVVKDSTGAFIPGATVTIVNKDTNLTKEAVTNGEGSYSLINLLPGPYDVKVALTG